MMTQIWVGDITLARARREKLIKVTGNSDLNKSMAKWLSCSSLAGIKPAKRSA